MKFTQCVAVLLAVAVASGTVNAQTQLQTGGKSSGTSTLLSNPQIQKELPLNEEQVAKIMDALSSGSLSSLLTNPDFARQLGLDEIHYLDAVALIDSYELATQMMLMIDPTLSDPSTVEKLELMQWFLELELYTALTPDQQQKLNVMWIQGQDSINSGLSSTLVAPGTNKKAK